MIRTQESLNDTTEKSCMTPLSRIYKTLFPILSKTVFQFVQNAGSPGYILARNQQEKLFPLAKM